MKILGTGLLGLVGSEITRNLKEVFEFENISRTEGVNIVDREAVLQKFIHSEASVVLHLAAKAHVDECEKDREIDQKNLEGSIESINDDTAWMVNVVGTQNIVEACEKTGKKLIYVSTDFVFDGINPPEDGYAEEDVPNPINWYGQTKYEGEKAVQNAEIDWLIMRISYPYSPLSNNKDFVHAIGNRLAEEKPVAAVTDQLITPTFLPDIAGALNAMIESKSTGIYHVSGSQFLSPLGAAHAIAMQFGLKEDLISETTRADFFKNRAPRPFQLKLKNAKIEQLGVNPRKFAQALSEVQL